MKINEIIKLLMVSRGINGTTLSKNVDIKKQVIYKFLAGDYAIGHDKLLDILNYFNLDVVKLAKAKVLNSGPEIETTKVGRDLEALYESIDEFQRSYQINYLITVCEKDLAKKPNQKVEKAIDNIREYYLREGR